MNEQNPAQAQNHSLSFTKLTAMIIGSTIGGGIFTTAGDMAASGAHTDRKSTRLNSSHITRSRMPSSA